MEIKQALAKLDTGNDGHWTQDGAPRLDALKDIAGRAVTREEIFKAAPKFSRANASLQPADPFAGGDGDKPEIIEGSTIPADDGEQTPPPVPELTKEEVTAVEAEFAAAHAEFTKAKKRLDAASVEMDKLITKREQEESGEQFSDTVQAFQQAQLKQRNKTSSARKRFLEIAADIEKNG